MLGAIIGDIAGSRYEWENIKTKDFVFMDKFCSVTDDSIMSLAIAKAIIECQNDYENLSHKAVVAMRELGALYPNAGYGGMFNNWIFSKEPLPYYSFGNGAAMRVSACGFAARTLEEAKELAYKVTAVTHNHPEGLKGAEATAVAIFLARNGYSISEIGDHIHFNYYKMDFSIDEIRDTYTYDESCQGTVPQAIMAFLDSTSFEDAIRNAISIGGDSDTIAAITGGIAEAYYGIPEDITTKALSFLDTYLLSIYYDFIKTYKQKNE